MMSRDSYVCGRCLRNFSTYEELYDHEVGHVRARSWGLRK